MIDKSLPEEISDFIYETNLVLERKKDFPLWMQVGSLGITHASRGMRLYRKIESIEKEINKKEVSKFSEYLNLLKAPAVGFTSGFINRMSESDKQSFAALSGEVIKDMFVAGNRQREIRKQMIKNNVSISELRKIADPEVKAIRNVLTSNMKYAFDRNLELPEDQLYELALHIQSVGEQ